MHRTIPRPRPIPAEIAELAAGHGHDPEHLLPILRTLNDRYGSLSRAALEDVAAALRVPPSRVYGVATFYSLLSTTPQPVQTIRVCDGVACWLHGSDRCRQALDRILAGRGDWSATRSSCLGLCDRAPAALVGGRQCGPLTPHAAPSLLDGWSGSPMSHSVPRGGETRFLLAHAGTIDPQSIDSALEHGVWSGLARAIRLQPVEVIAEIEAAALRGRGGAGFPTARKWRTVAQAPPGPRYVVCNADESEPLAFKDRVLLETNPHAILEGLAIAGYAVGAERGFVYIRGEYEPQATLLARAIEQSRERGWLGERIAGTEFHFDVELHRGGGAYICGEESALLESLAGRRGEPRARPPYPAIAGYQGQPTAVNNVETLAYAAAILQRGAAAGRALGAPEHPGTRLYAILGHVQQPGLIEAPMGLTVRQLVENFAGGLRPGSKFGCALVGGAAGVLINEQLLDVPLGLPGEPSTIPAGTGAVLVCDDSVSPVRVLRELLHFFEHESCGKCTPCRIGTSAARRTLNAFLSGDAVPDDLQRLTQLAETLHTTSLCGLGVSVAEPIRSALANFGAAFHQLVRR